MACIWWVDKSGGWTSTAIPQDSRYVLLEGPASGSAPKLKPRRRIRRASGARAQPSALLVRTGMARSERWFLVPYPGTRLDLNGGEILGGVSALRHKDVFGPAGSCKEWVFTTERHAHVESYRSDTEAYCVRCKLALKDGQRVVVCPSCFAIHHQDASLDLPCWTYADTCAQCSRGTRMNNAYAWTPDDL